MSRVSSIRNRACTDVVGLTRLSRFRRAEKGREARITSWSNLHAARFNVSICFCAADYFLTGSPFDFDEPIVLETRARAVLLVKKTPLAEYSSGLNKFITCIQSRISTHRRNLHWLRINSRNGRNDEITQHLRDTSWDNEGKNNANNLSINMRNLSHR